MPKKKSPKGRRGSKRKKSKASAGEKDEVKGKSKIFLRSYQANCLASNSVPLSRVLASCRDCLEDGKPFTKVFVETSPEVTTSKDPKSASGKSGAKVRKSAKIPPRTGSTAAPKERLLPDIIDKPSRPSVVLLQPLFKSLREACYDYMRCLYVWNYPVNDDGAVSIALFLETPFAMNLKVLELRSTELTPWALVRLSKPLNKIPLTQINLDYNEISCEVLGKLCSQLQANPSLQNLSLNYCNLDHTCGEPLGTYVATSQIRSLSLIGNMLQCDGCSQLIRPLVALCESSSFNAIKLDTDGPGPSKGVESVLSASATKSTATLMPSRSREPSPAPTGGPSTALAGESSSSKAAGEPSTSVSSSVPPLARLDLRDNAIDPHGVCNEGEQTFEPVICMRAIKRWMISCPGIEELNLDHNLIGDGGARELLQGLIERKEAGLPTMKLIVTVYISPDTFQKIIEYSTAKKKKKKKKKSKG